MADEGPRTLGLDARLGAHRVRYRRTCDFNKVIRSNFPLFFKYLQLYPPYLGPYSLDCSLFVVLLWSSGSGRGKLLSLQALDYI